MATVADDQGQKGRGFDLFKLTGWIDSRQSMKWIEVSVALVIVAMAAFTAFVLIGEKGETEPLKPLMAAILLLANLLPAAAMLVLIGRRRALKRSVQSDTNSRQLLHVRLVAIFSLIAIVPTFLLVIFASFLFQSGVQFWFSDSARDMLENAGSLAEGYYEEKLNDVGSETTTMAGDIRFALNRFAPDNPAFLDGYVKQVIGRKLSESAIVQIRPDGRQDTLAVISPDDDTKKDKWIDAETLGEFASGKNLVVRVRDESIVATTLLFDGPAKTYLFAKRTTSVPTFKLGEKAQSVLTSYRDMVARSQRLQFQFNIALYVISLAIIAIVVWVALLVADRLIRPVNNLVTTAQKIADGDLTVRVPEDTGLADEVSLLSRSFNDMTAQLEFQRKTLVNTNRQLDDRRAFIEAVLESVSAGIISTDRDNQIRLTNSTALALLGDADKSIVGQELKEIAPRFDDLIKEGRERAVIQIGDGPEPQTLAVKISERDAGYVVTFEDISQQLSDQKSAAWSDVARRIAHEIKNPLTPIQLAAERLQRRFGKKLEEGQEDSKVFGQLTETIVRQVGDLRKIVDEFSSFARMPKPVFREENLTDIVAQSVFLFQVANDGIKFEFGQQGEDFPLVCDRRQIAQAVTNLLKNASESITEYAEANGEKIDGNIDVSIYDDDKMRIVEMSDNGKGFPADRDRIIEPYVTTRTSGSGLGLAIVRKIIEEHYGELLLSDREDGARGARIRLVFDSEALAAQYADSCAAAENSMKQD